MDNCINIDIGQYYRDQDEHMAAFEEDCRRELEDLKAEKDKRRDLMLRALTSPVFTQPQAQSTPFPAPLDRHKDIPHGDGNEEASKLKTKCRHERVASAPSSSSMPSPAVNSAGAPDSSGSNASVASKNRADPILLTSTSAEQEEPGNFRSESHTASVMDVDRDDNSNKIVSRKRKAVESAPKEPRLKRIKPLASEVEPQGTPMDIDTAPVRHEGTLESKPLPSSARMKRTLALEDSSIEEIESFDVPSVRKSPRVAPVERKSPAKKPVSKKPKVVTLERKGAVKNIQATRNSPAVDDVADFSVIEVQATVADLGAHKRSSNSSLLEDMRLRIARQEGRKRDKLATRGDVTKSPQDAARSSSVIPESSPHPSPPAKKPAPTSSSASGTRKQPVSSAAAVASSSKQPVVPTSGSKRISRAAILSLGLEGVTGIAPPKPKRPAAKPKKPKKELIPLKEFRQRIIDNPPKMAKQQHLAGHVIFYVAGDYQYASERTQDALRYMSKHGATLLVEYDPSIVTEVVVDSDCRNRIYVECKIKSLGDIPEHIPTVLYSWAHTPRIISEKDEEPRYKMDEYFNHAAFSARFDAGCEKLVVRKRKPHLLPTTSSSRGDRPRKSKRVDTDTEDEGADCESIPSDPPPPLANFSNDQVNHNPEDDPLAEFYDIAREQCQAAFSRRGEAEETDPDCSDVEEVIKKKKQKKGFLCDNKFVRATTKSPNYDVVEKLKELKKLHENKPGNDNFWKVLAYRKAIPEIEKYPTRIRSQAEAEKIPGVAEKTAKKIMEIIETGDLQRIQHETTADVITMNLFRGIYGVGSRTAMMWYANGCRTLDDLLARKGGIKLNRAQELGIKYYDDINTRMPREEAQAIYDLIKPTALSLDSKLFVEIMGSFRRGKADCGDIDILITRCPDDGRTHRGILGRLLKALRAKGIITEDLAVPDNFNDLENCYRGLCRLPNTPGARHRRIDFLTVPWKSRGAALLYYTGDDLFNRSMRLKAGKMGYSLNQKGLSSGVVRDPQRHSVKLNKGTIIASETEEEIFKIVGVPWQQPHERVRS